MNSFTQLFVYARSQRYAIFLATLCSVLNTLFDILPEILIGVALNVVVKGQYSVLASWGIIDVKMQLVVVGIATFLIWGLESLFQYFHTVLWRSLAQRIQHELRLIAYVHLQSMPMAYYEQKPTGVLIAMLNDDINQLERFFDEGMHQFIYLIVSSVVAMSIFWYLSPLIAVLALLPLPCIFFMAFFFQKKLGDRYLKVRESASAVASRLVNNITGIATIKSYTAYDYERKRLERDSKAYQNANMDAITLSAAFIPAVRMAIVFGFMFTLVLGGWYVVDGYLEVGGYSVLVFQTQRLLWPFTELAYMTDFYGRAMASSRRVFELLREPTETGGTHHLIPAQVKGALTFHDVSFIYPDGTWIFDKFNLAIAPATTVAFVGVTGSGKSTIIKLLLRFYEPSEGRILLDDVDITTIALQDLREVIGLVSQDVFLFEGTIQENIAYGTFDATYEQVVEAAKLAEAHDFIEQLPEGYCTVIGERGQKLSGGQRQRISIARAVLKNAPILIFDEATSALDYETEAAVQRSLAKITKNHTVIMIAHRLSTIRAATTIFVMSEGGIVESGTHDELLRKGGTYHALWHIQTGE